MRSNASNCMMGIPADSGILLPVEEKKPYPRGAIGATAMKRVRAAKTPRVLVVDVGGTNIKMLATGQKEVRKIPSGPTMTAGKVGRVVKGCLKDWKVDGGSLGYPGTVINGH